MWEWAALMAIEIALTSGQGSPACNGGLLLYLSVCSHMSGYVNLWGCSSAGSMRTGGKAGQSVLPSIWA